MNREQATKWPNIRQKREPLPEAEEHKSVPDKYRRFFSPNPGSGT